MMVLDKYVKFSFMGFLLPKKIFFFCGAGDGSQGLARAGTVLCHWATAQTALWFAMSREPVVWLSCPGLSLTAGHGFSPEQCNKVTTDALCSKDQLNLNPTHH
jgi:hypothetical protein